jgi:hypothetical protein
MRVRRLQMSVRSSRSAEGGAMKGLRLLGVLAVASLALPASAQAFEWEWTNPGGYHPIPPSMNVKVPFKGKFFFTLNPGSVYLKCIVHGEEEVENVGDVGKDTMLAFESVGGCKVKTKGVVCVEPPSVKAAKPWPSELVGTTGIPVDEFTGVELDVTCVESNGTSYTGTYGSPLATLKAILTGPRLGFLGGSAAQSLSGPGSKTVTLEGGSSTLRVLFAHENHVHKIM